jgi:hypothetical protein
VKIAAPSSVIPVSYGTASVGANAGTDADPASTTTTTSPPPTTTATAAPTNGVIATASNSNYSYCGGQERVSVANSSSITAITVTVNVAQRTGVTYNRAFNSFPGWALTQGTSTSRGMIRYTWALDAGQSTPANYSGGQVGAQFNGTGSVRVTSGDAWTVTSTSGGVSSTLRGTLYMSSSDQNLW